MSKLSVINRVFKRDWILLADSDVYYRDYPPQCPGVYVLGISKGRGPKKIIYAGQSCDSLYHRIAAYATTGSHISRQLNDYFQDGYSLYYKYRVCISKDPRDIEDYLLSQINFPCNSRHNGGYQ